MYRNGTKKEQIKKDIEEKGEAGRMGDI